MSYPYDPNRKKGAVTHYDSQSFEHFVDLLHAIQMGTAGLRSKLSSRFDGCGYLWRGQRNADWGLKASVHRMMSASDADFHETRDLYEFTRACETIGMDAPDARKIATEPEAKRRAMALAQHYGLQTALLDWSESPLFALGHAVWSSILHLEGLQPAPSPESLPRLALWRFDPFMALPNTEVVRNADPRNPRQRNQHGLYTRVSLSDDFPECDLRQIAEADESNLVSLTCLTFPGKDYALAYHWLHEYHVIPEIAYGGYEGAAKRALVERARRNLRRRRLWFGGELEGDNDTDY